MIVLEKIEEIQGGLKILRLTILILSTAQLFLTLFNSNHVFIVSVIISVISALLFLQKHLAPVSYKFFILILLLDSIYSGGHFVEMVFSKQPLTPAFILINIFTIFVIVLFMVVLWRHYQLCQVTQQIQFHS